MRRFARTALAAAFALLVPWSAASAATTGDPGGSNLTTITENRCATGICTSISFNVLRFDGSPVGVCLDITYTDEAGVPTDTESGCSDGAVGAVTSAGGFLTGIGPSQLTLANGAGATRVVTVSGEHGLLGQLRQSSSDGTWEEDGCRFIYSYRERAIDVTGTVTLDGVSYASDGVTTVFQQKLKVRC